MRQRQKLDLSLVQMMACGLSGAKPLSEPMLEYCQNRLLGANFRQILIESRVFFFIQKNTFENAAWNRWSFCLGLNTLTLEAIMLRIKIV